MSESDPFGDVLAAYFQAVDEGQAPDREELLARHPEVADRLREFFAAQDDVVGVTAPLREPGPGPEGQFIGPYELLGEIGRGGMGVVFRARHAALGRLVALKLLAWAGPGTEERRERLRQEAEFLARLEHPNIVPVYEVGEHEGRPFFAMKLIEGRDLAAELPRLRADLPSAVRVLETVARAVHFAHEKGVIHRDLKPSNVLLDGAGGVFVSDFGLARRLDADPALTASGALVGTPGYMAPEQACGEKAPGPAADVWALGVILYELLAGQLPFQGETPLETLHRVVGEEPVPPRRHAPQASRALEHVCLRCLERDPRQRYTSAAALADDLGRWLGGRPVWTFRFRPLPPLRRGAGWLLGQWRKFAALALLVLLLLALAVDRNRAGQRCLDQTTFALANGHLQLARDTFQQMPVGSRLVLSSSAREQDQRLECWFGAILYQVEGSHGEWSPDGRWLRVRQSRGGPDLGIVNARTGEDAVAEKPPLSTFDQHQDWTIRSANRLLKFYRLHDPNEFRRSIAESGEEEQKRIARAFQDLPAPQPAVFRLDESSGGRSPERSLFILPADDWRVRLSPDERSLFFFRARVSVGLVQATYDLRERRWTRLVEVRPLTKAPVAESESSGGRSPMGRLVRFLGGPRLRWFGPWFVDQLGPRGKRWVAVGVLSIGILASSPQPKTTEERLSWMELRVYRQGEATPSGLLAYPPCLADCRVAGSLEVPLLASHRLRYVPRQQRDLRLIALLLEREGLDEQSVSPDGALLFDADTGTVAKLPTADDE